MATFPDMTIGPPQPAQTPLPQNVPVIPQPAPDRPAPARLIRPRGKGGYGEDMTLAALMARQKELADQAQGVAGMNAGTIPQGLAMLANSFVNALQRRQAERAATEAQGEVSNALTTGLNQDTGQLSPEASAVLWRRDPETAMELMKTAMTLRASAGKQDVWTPIPTPPGENGQWFKNQNGDTKKVGGGSPGEGEWKPSDIGGLRDDYTKAASVWDQAAPTWQSMLETYGRVKDLKEGQTQEGAGTADYALVIGLAKLMDPNSVVREGEVESVRRTGGATDRFISILSDLSGGGSLSPAVRRGLMTEASTRMKSYYDQVKTKRDAVSEIATRHNIDPRDVVYPLAEFTPYTVGGDDRGGGGGGGGVVEDDGTPAEPAPAKTELFQPGHKYKLPNGEVGVFVGGDPNVGTNWKKVKQARKVY